MPPEYTLIIILGIVFFTIVFIRVIWLAVKTKEKAFWYISIVYPLFILSLASILLGNPVVCVILMFFIGPYSLVISLKYGRKIISVQTKSSLKGWSPLEPTKFSDFLTMKGWIKLAGKRGKDQALFIYFLFNLFICSIAFIGLNLIFDVGITNFIFSTGIGLIISMMFFSTALNTALNYQSDKQASKKATIKQPPEYEKLLHSYLHVYGKTGKWQLDREIEHCIKKGLTQKEAILKLAKD